METTKNKAELLKDMQNISNEVAKKKEEVELLLKVIDNLEKEYYIIAEQIQSN